MFDIFLSYSSEDADRAAWFVRSFEANGWSVFHDRDQIPPGVRFDEFIDQALQSSRCVVVLWTRASVRANFVLNEMACAMAKDPTDRYASATDFADHLETIAASFGLPPRAAGTKR